MVRGFLAVCIVAFTTTCLAQLVTSAKFSTAISNRPVFDVSSRYVGVAPFLDGTRSLEFSIHHRANGRLAGTGAVAWTTSTYEVAGARDVHGRYRGFTSGDRVALRFNVPVTGYEASGDPLDGHFRFRASAVRAGSASFTGSGTSAVCFPGEACHHDDELFNIVPSAYPWMLSIDVDTVGNRIRGVGQVWLLSNRAAETNILGRGFHYVAEGRFNERTRSSVIRLIGKDEDKGSSFLIRCKADFQVESLRGRLLGQDIDLKGPFAVVR